LSADHSCRAAVARLLAHRLARGQSPCSPETGAYCQARQRLPESFFADVARHTGQALDAQVDPRWLWKRRRVYIYDGSSVSMPDTPRNQAEYPQPDTQKPGLGFPLARIAAIFSLGKTQRGAALPAGGHAGGGGGGGHRLPARAPGGRPARPCRAGRRPLQPRGRAGAGPGGDLRARRRRITGRRLPGGSGRRADDAPGRLRPARPRRLRALLHPPVRGGGDRPRRHPGLARGARLPVLESPRGGWGDSVGDRTPRRLAEGEAA
jgi:hypothetical protein